MRPISALAGHVGLSTLALLLCSCGGEGNSSPTGGSNNPTPAPSSLGPPAPTPSPTLVPSALALTSTGLTQQQDFATFGYSSTLLAYPDDGIAHNAVTQWDDASQITFRFLSNVGRFEIGIPGLGLRQLEDCRALNPQFADCLAGREPVSNRALAAFLLRPDYPALPLRWTSLVSYQTGDGPTVLTPTTLYGGVLAYGVPAPVSAVPLAGTATGSAVVLTGGVSLNLVALQFDFARRTVNGSFTYVIPPNEYEANPIAVTFNVVLIGNIGLDGRISGTITGDASSGEFEGVFAGETASELMLRLKFSVLKGSANIPVHGALAGQVSTPAS